jgi:hypothetical protein
VDRLPSPVGTNWELGPLGSAVLLRPLSFPADGLGEEVDVGGSYINDE